MTNSELVNNTIVFVKKELENAEGGHDWFHIERVYRNSLLIAQTEEVDVTIISLGALLHDIADSKFHGGDESVGPKMAREWLESQNTDGEVIKHVINIIDNISFKGGNQEQKFRSPELEVVQDADRLDAIGAIGIARAFNYGGYKDMKIYDPTISPKLDMTKEEYKKSKAPTINHFYEKLLLLQDRMNTSTGRRLAKKRHAYMEGFLEQFYREWNGEV